MRNLIDSKVKYGKNQTNKQIIRTKETYQDSKNKIQMSRNLYKEWKFNKDTFG